MRTTISLVASLTLLSSLTLRADTLPEFQPVSDALAEQIQQAEHGATPDGKLAATLKKTQALINKPGAASLANDLKLLSVAAPALAKTKVASSFEAPLNQTVDSYQGLVNSAADASASRLNGIHASKQHDAAQKSLDGVYATLQAAEQTSDLKTAVKLIGQANMKLVSTGKLIDAAAKAPQPPAPPAGVTATVSGATSWSFKSTGAAAVEQSANNVLVNSAQAITKAPYGQRTITFALNGLQPGANTITAVGGSTFMVTEIYATGGAGGTGASYSGKSGNIQVNYNQSANTVSGTFDVSCEDERSPGRVISVKGSFSATIRK